MSRLIVSLGAIVLTAATARANNILLTVMPCQIYTPPEPFQPGETVLVAVRINYETTTVNSLELFQVDLKITNATLLPQFDPDDLINPITDPVIFGGASPGPFDPPCSIFAGPGLPGCPANCLIGTVPSSAGGGTIYFWLRTSTSNAHLLNPPAPSGLGRLFIQFKVVLDGPPGTTAIIDALGPGLDDGSGSGAFAQQAVTAQQWANGDSSIDPDDAFNFVGGTLSITTVPEPGGLAMLMGAFAYLPSRRARLQIRR